jgi:hypothetical protein
VLDFQKQGFLDAFTLDYFLRTLLDKVRAHEGEDDTPTIERLRVGPTCSFSSLAPGAYDPRRPLNTQTQAFDAVAPAHPARITWQDLQRCKLGHDVVR